MMVVKRQISVKTC